MWVQGGFEIAVCGVEDRPRIGADTCLSVLIGAGLLRNPCPRSGTWGTRRLDGWRGAATTKWESGSGSLLGLEETDCDDEDRYQEDERADDPHDGGAGDLIGNRRDVEGVGLPEIVAVDGAVAEGEECGEGGVDDVGGGQVEQHEPAGMAHMGWPGPDDGPPEEGCSAEETHVFELVPVFVLEREVVGGGDVPSEEDEVQCEPGDQRRGEDVAQAAQEL